MLKGVLCTFEIIPCSLSSMCNDVCLKMFQHPPVKNCSFLIACIIIPALPLKYLQHRPCKKITILKMFVASTVHTLQNICSTFTATIIAHLKSIAVLIPEKYVQKFTVLRLFAASTLQKNSSFHPAKYLNQHPYKKNTKIFAASTLQKTRHF